jgi:hypothetical protein
MDAATQGKAEIVSQKFSVYLPDLIPQMMEINPTGRYYNYLSQNERYLNLFRVMGIIGTMSAGLLLLPFLAYFIRTKCTLTFTNSLRTVEGQLVVNYTKFFRNREIAFPLADTVLELRQYHDDIRTPSYYQLAIRYKQNIKYTLDSREGYEKDTLLAFMGAFATAQSAAVAYPA